MNKNLLITKIVVYSILVIFLLCILLTSIHRYHSGSFLDDLIYYFGDYNHDYHYSYNYNNNYDHNHDYNYNYNYDHKEKYSSYTDYNNGDTTIPADDIDNIYIEWTKGEINVETHDKNTIEITETGNINDDNKLLYNIKNKDLHIVFHKRIKHYFNFRSFEDKTLTIKIPKDKHLFLLDIETVSPTINIKDINTNALNIETVSGSINIINTNANFCDVETVSGKIDINGTFKKIDSNNVSGKTNIQSSICPKSIDVESVSGSITIDIPENDGFTADFDTVSGKFSSQFEGVTNKNRQVYKNGRNEIDAETVSGSFTINKIQ